MTPYFEDDVVKIYLGDCLDILPGISCIDTVITDPPYGLKFMGKDWDHGIPGVHFWELILGACKPGAMCFAFGGTRTHHRLMCAIEDAGWELRDVMMWVYGSGFPKSHNISKAIDKANGEIGRLLKFVEWMRSTGLTAGQINGAIGKSDIGSHYLRRDQPAIPTAALWAKLRPLCGDVPEWVDELVERIEAERDVVGKKIVNGEEGSAGGYANGIASIRGMDVSKKREIDLTIPATQAAKQWDGWGTALKPAWEPIILSMKPLDGTFAENALKHGVAGLNIDGGRVGGKKASVPQPRFDSPTGKTYGFKTGEGRNGDMSDNTKGRWPANLIHDGSDEVVKGFPETTENGYRKNPSTNKTTWFGAKGGGHIEGERGFPDSGSAARFFYCSKAAPGERDFGLEGMEYKQTKGGGGTNNTPDDVCGKYGSVKAEMRNHHPTVKPVDLIRYLALLSKTPTAGVILDPFMGSGTTLVAAKMAGRKAIGIELNEEYAEIAAKRVQAQNQEVLEI